MAAPHTAVVLGNRRLAGFPAAGSKSSTGRGWAPRRR